SISRRICGNWWNAATSTAPRRWKWRPIPSSSRWCSRGSKSRRPAFCRFSSFAGRSVGGGSESANCELQNANYQRSGSIPRRDKEAGRLLRPPGHFAIRNSQFAIRNRLPDPRSASWSRNCCWANMPARPRLLLPSAQIPPDPDHLRLLDPHGLVGVAGLPHHQDAGGNVELSDIWLWRARSFDRVAAADILVVVSRAGAALCRRQLNLRWPPQREGRTRTACLDAASSPH